MLQLQPTVVRARPLHGLSVWANKPAPGTAQRLLNMVQWHVLWCIINMGGYDGSRTLIYRQSCCSLVFMPANVPAGGH